jgi:hypothetical protein
MQAVAKARWRFGWALSLLAACDPKASTPAAQPGGECVAFTEEPEVPARPGVRSIAIETCERVKILFVNFEGGKLTAARRDNARENQSSVLYHSNFAEGTTFDYPVYRGSAEDRELTLGRVRTALAPYGVQVVSQRPTSGDYAMIMVGGFPEDVHRSDELGAGAIDCENRNGLNIAFAYSERIALRATPDTPFHLRLARTISHEAGHGFGLAHITDENTDIMYVGTEQGSRSFADYQFNALSMSVATGITCGRAQQDDHEILLRNLSPTACTHTGAAPDDPSPSTTSNDETRTGLGELVPTESDTTPSGDLVGGCSLVAQSTPPESRLLILPLLGALALRSRSSARSRRERGARRASTSPAGR